MRVGQHRLVFFAFVSWAAPALAAQSNATMNPDPVDVGNVVVGATGMKTGTLSDNNNDHVDLVFGPCNGSGSGNFTLTPNNNIDLNNPVQITVMYHANTSGPRQCTIDVHFHSSSTRIGSFTIDANGQDPPTISLPGPQTFGTVRFNNAAPSHTSSQTITVFNTGDLTLNVTNVQIGGTNGGDFSITSGGTTASIQPNNSSQWSVQFDPTAAGMRSAMVTFTSNDPAHGSASVGLSGTGSTAVISVNNQNYGIVNTGSSSSLDITVSNSGGSPTGNLGVTSAAINGGNGWFTFSACGGGGSCTFMPALSISGSQPVGITCTPPATANPADQQTATVTFTSDSDNSGGNVSSVTCTAGKSALVTSAPEVMFPSQLVATASTAQMVNVMNTGNVSTSVWLRVTGLDAAMFSASTGMSCGTDASNTCAVAAGATLPFTITFTPSVEGDVSAGLDIVASGTFPQMTLAGRGIDRHISMENQVTFPTTFRNPGDMAAVVPVAVNNIGEYMLHVSALSTIGAPEWTIASPTDPFDVPGLSSMNVMVKFAPREVGKVNDGQLQVTSDDRVNPLTVTALLGYGKLRDVQMAPPSIDLGDTGAGIPTKLSDVHPDTPLLVMNNDPDNTFHIQKITMDGDDVFKVQTQSGDAVDGMALAPGATQPLDVVFVPPTLGDFNANITLFLDQDTDAQPTQIAVHGRALFVDAHGSGGCSAGGSGGAAVVLAIGLLLLRRRRTGMAVLVLVLVPAASRAEPTRNIDLTVFDPTPTTSGSSFQLQNADVGKNGEYVATALASYASGPLVLGTLDTTDSVVRNRTMMTLGGAYAFLGWLEGGAHMPFFQQNGETVPAGQLGAAPAKGTAIGDLTLHLKARLATFGAASFGAAIAVELPTATDSQFAGPDKPSGRGLALFTYAPTPRLAFNVNAGGVVRASAEFANIQERSGFTGGFGASLRVLDPLTVTAEVYGDVTPHGYVNEPPEGSTMGTTSTLYTMEALGGVRYQLTQQFSVSAGGGRGLTKGVGSPGMRAMMVFAFTPKAAAQPTVHRPDPVVQQQVLHKGDMDVDRIPDDKDKCPTEPEDMDGFQDEDGCPDPDNDNDGIPDEKDKCPNVPEDKDGFEDADGCPDPDNDKDGIPDVKDKCPDKPETINGFQDEDGCPDAGDALVVIGPERLDLLASIEFTGPTISKTSQNLMAQIGATMRARADIARLRIAAHVQPTAHPEKDQALSDRRAAAVRDWLVQWGIAADRFEIKGYGGKKPLVPVKDKSSAQINNRIELIILDRK